MKLPHRRKFLHLAAGAAVLPAISRFAFAQAYPSRPVRVIFGLASGSAGDILARLIGQWLSGRLGQPFVIEDRPGAGSNIGTEAVVRASPDGHTLLMAGGYNAINATLYDNAYRGAALIRAAVSSATTAVTCRRCFVRAHKLCWPSET